jgi:hypothetical protein
MRALKRFLGASLPDELVLRSRSDGPLLETTILNQGLHPSLKALGLPKGCTGFDAVVTGDGDWPGSTLRLSASKWGLPPLA